MSGTSQALGSWSSRDLMFVAQSLVPERCDAVHVADLLREDGRLLEAMLKDEKLLHSLVDDDAGFYSVSPRFYFKVLLTQCLHDVQAQIEDIANHPSRRAMLSGAQKTMSFLTKQGTRDYLAALLAYYTEPCSRLVPVQVRLGTWRKVRVNDLDVNSLIGYVQTLDEPKRFPTFQRIADSCLFLTSLFPESIESGHCYPAPSGPRPRLASALIHSLEDHTSLGRTYYRLAGHHQEAAKLGLDAVLVTLSEEYGLAQRALAFLTRRYLAIRKRQLFRL